MSLPAGLRNSHQNGGWVFLIFVADPRTLRLCKTRHQSREGRSGPHSVVRRLVHDALLADDEAIMFSCVGAGKTLGARGAQRGGATGTGGPPVVSQLPGHYPRRCRQLRATHHRKDRTTFRTSRISRRPLENMGSLPLTIDDLGHAPSRTMRRRPASMALRLRRSRWRVRQAPVSRSWRRSSSPGSRSPGGSRARPEMQARTSGLR
jgi:hypothetical protein